MSFATVQDGHKALAQTFKKSADLWCARGTLPDNYPGKWSISETPPDSLTSVSWDEVIRKGNSGSLDATKHTDIRKIYSITNAAGNVTYNPTSYTKNNQIATNGIQWEIGETQPAQGDDYKASYLYTNQDIKTLVKPLDFIRVNSMYFVKEDPLGTVEAGGKKWSLSENDAVTPFVYCLWKFPANANLNKTIYQLGIYTGTKTDIEETTGLANYVENIADKQPDQHAVVTAATTGNLFMIDNIRPFTTSENVRLYVELIISF